jgi:hypothetical protein
MIGGTISESPPLLFGDITTNTPSHQLFSSKCKFFKVKKKWLKKKSLENCGGVQVQICANKALRKTYFLLAKWSLTKSISKHVD